MLISPRSVHLATAVWNCWHWRMVCLRAGAARVCSKRTGEESMQEFFRLLCTAPRIFRLKRLRDISLTPENVECCCGFFGKRAHPTFTGGCRGLDTNIGNLNRQKEIGSSAQKARPSKLVPPWVCLRGCFRLYRARLVLLVIVP